MKVMKLQDALNKCGIGRSTLFRLVREGEFPAPMKTGGRNLVWLEAELDGWIQKKIDARDSKK